MALRQNSCRKIIQIRPFNEFSSTGIKLLRSTFVKEKYMQSMAAVSTFSKFVSWLKSPEVFGSITKKIPGEWQLFEYYVDEQDDLINLKEEDLKNNQESLVIAFREDELFALEARLPLPLFEAIRRGNWSVHRNFITLIDPADFRNNVEFQFAFEKGNLKLLKKDARGKIEFFGFFKSMK